MLRCLWTAMGISPCRSRTDAATQGRGFIFIPTVPGVLPLKHCVGSSDCEILYSYRASQDNADPPLPLDAVTEVVRRDDGGGIIEECVHCTVLPSAAFAPLLM